MNVLVERPIELINQLGRLIEGRREIATLQRLRAGHEAARSQNPDDPAPLHWLAAIAHRLKKFDEAAELLKAALAKDGCHPDAPIAIYEYFTQTGGVGRTAGYLDWYMKRRDASVFAEIDTFVDWLRTSRYVDYPLAIHIETMALCNASCTFCQYPELTRKGDIMPDSLIHKIIDELDAIPKDLPCTITLAGVSEPFLDKRVFDNIELINRKLPHVSIGINTNGAPLTEKNIDRLSKLNISQMSVSVNDYRKEHYEKIMGISYDRTISVLKMLDEKSRNGDIPFKLGATRAGDGTIEDLHFIKWVRENFPSLTNYFTPQFVWVGEEVKSLAPAPSVGCTHWFDITVRSTGEVAFCCIDGHIEFPRGNLHRENILDVYNRPDYRALRESKITRPDVEQCRTCTSG
jgi:hypothetical protein